MVGQVSLSWDRVWVTHKIDALGSKTHIGIEILWCSYPRGKLLTSLLRQAFKFNGLLDMKNCHVVSAQGWGPGCSGAYCTFRINRRAEFLRSSRRQQGGTLCLAEAGVLHSCAYTQEVHWQVEQSWTSNHGALLNVLALFKRGTAEDRQTHVFYYLLWILSSTFSVEKAFTSKSTPQLCQKEVSVTSQEHLRMFKHLPVH